MSLRSRWNRVDAEHRVHWLLCTQTFVLVLFTLWVFADGWAHDLELFALFPAMLVAFSGWLTAAWRRGRAWAWGVATILVGLRFVGTVLSLLDGELSWLGWALFVFDGLLLAYLFHPKSRARLQPPAAQTVGAQPAAAARRPGPGS
jgi:hypothetical protein